MMADWSLAYSEAQGNLNAIETSVRKPAIMVQVMVSSALVLVMDTQSVISFATKAIVTHALI